MGVQKLMQGINKRIDANETTMKSITNLLMTADDNFTELNATNDHNDKRINTLDRSFLQIHQGNKEWKNISKKNNSKVIAYGEAIETLQYDNGQLQSEMKTLKATVDKNATNQQTTDDDFEFRIASLEDAKKEESDNKTTEISDELVEAVAAKITAQKAKKNNKKRSEPEADIFADERKRNSLIWLEELVKSLDKTNRDKYIDSDMESLNDGNTFLIMSNQFKKPLIKLFSNDIVEHLGFLGAYSVPESMRRYPVSIAYLDCWEYEWWKPDEIVTNNREKYKNENLFQEEKYQNLPKNSSLLSIYQHKDGNKKTQVRLIEGIVSLALNCHDSFKYLAFIIVTKGYPQIMMPPHSEQTSISN